jgi:hypothetical protein
MRDLYQGGRLMNLTGQFHQATPPSPPSLHCVSQAH